jgi:predicted unusual protein kinase regulating ubiquinone biosynthesis (AarF/ABC1/UbiB family)
MRSEEDQPEQAGSERPKDLSRIPTSKVKRAAKILGTSAKVGGNYIKYYAKKTVNPGLSKDTLHAENAGDIYASLSELKGSALKVAQMMSMDNTVLPKAYQDKFAMAQYNAPPLSYPLILKTFQQYFGQKPLDIFDEFSKDAVHAASIGQVHKARKEELNLAVKIQYPGVAESISSDLKLVKPLASQLLNMKASDMKLYMDEVESKLLEETDYELELRSGTEIGEACAFISGLRFPHYYPEWSNRRIITMDWIEGKMLPEFLKTDPSPEIRNKIGQSMWDFFLYQMKVMRKVHADPHPGNFIVDADNNLCVIDFGCIKEIPSDFFDNYFQLLKPEVVADQQRLEEIYEQLDMFKAEDTPKEKALLQEVYMEMITIIGLPFQSETFDFSDETYFKQLFGLGEEISQNKELRKMNNARGSKHAIYIMRTFFGLYSLLHQLKATVKLNYTLD